MKKAFAFSMIAIMFFSACKKEDNGPPPLNSTSMKVGKAGIRFTANTAFNGNKNFDVVNTNETSATTTTLSGGTIRNIKVEATEIIDNLPSRKVLIDFVVREVSTINLSLRSGFPLGNIRLESYSVFGIIRRSVSGTLTVTKLTTTEVEGNFTATFDDGMVINNGSFAGKF